MPDRTPGWLSILPHPHSCPAQWTATPWFQCPGQNNFSHLCFISSSYSPWLIHYLMLLTLPLKPELAHSHSLHCVCGPSHHYLLPGLLGYLLTWSDICPWPWALLTGQPVILWKGKSDHATVLCLKPSSNSHQSFLKTNRFYRNLLLIPCRHHISLLTSLFLSLHLFLPDTKPSWPLAVSGAFQAWSHLEDFA